MVCTSILRQQRSFGQIRVVGHQFDTGRFRAFACKPLRMITVGDVQQFANSIEHLADASRSNPSVNQGEGIAGILGLA